MGKGDGGAIEDPFTPPEGAPKDLPHLYPGPPEWLYDADKKVAGGYEQGYGAGGG